MGDNENRSGEPVHGEEADEQQAPDKRPWSWRGVAWLMAAASVFVAWGWTQDLLHSDPQIVEFFRAVRNHQYTFRAFLLAASALAFANAVPIAAFLMGLRFLRREHGMPSHGTQARSILMLSGFAGVVVSWFALSEAWVSPPIRMSAKMPAITELAQIAKELNKNAPVALGDGIRILGVVAVGNRLHYKYQYTNVKAADIDGEYLRMEAQKQSIVASCSDPSLRSLLDRLVIISKTYVDMDQVHLATFEVSSDDCRRLESTRDAGQEEMGLRPSANEAARQAAVMATAALPPGTVLREGLVSEGAEAVGGHVVYRYRFEFPKERINPAWISSLSSTLPSQYCRMMTALVESGVSAEWRYFDSEGTLVLSVKGTPAECQE